MSSNSWKEARIFLTLNSRPLRFELLIPYRIDVLGMYFKQTLCLVNKIIILRNKIIYIKNILLKSTRRHFQFPNLPLQSQVYYTLLPPRSDRDPLVVLE
jgi:hypothetical protein